MRKLLVALDRRCWRGDDDVAAAIDGDPVAVDREGDVTWWPRCAIGSQREDSVECIRINAIIEHETSIRDIQPHDISEGVDHRRAQVCCALRVVIRVVIRWLRRLALPLDLSARMPHIVMHVFDGGSVEGPPY